ncbi:acid protease [Stereum hirsutum FP-91666 SS1]|uniref:acid protease n=1 Tax=Stereum hirsutum (strain FP-91666) TaxID=721885 RepID=UPI000440C658|nr:acid protease [Stereum hirsutum FP-91666 SS1]EIM90784.1 acid protease [Stereum hirsutum FP-91666 SS1]
MSRSFYVLANVGNISFQLALDTASSDLWLLSSDCTSSTCSSIPQYPLTYESSTFGIVNGNLTEFNVSFADTTGVSGFVAREEIMLGPAANLTMQNQAIGLVTQSNVTFVDDISGLLGLGFPRLSTINALAANATPFFSNLAQQVRLDYPLFGLSLTRNATPGSLALGAIDSSIVQNLTNIAWSEVVPFRPFSGSAEALAGNASSYLQWAVGMGDILVGSTTVTPRPTYSEANSNTSIALFDVGTTGIFGPWQDVARIFDSMTGSRLVDVEGGIWAMPCDTTATMTFTFSGQNFTLLPSDYLAGPISSDTNECIAYPNALSPSSDGIDWQLGSPFMRTVYSVFSYGITGKEPPMIGLYPLNDAFASSSSTSSSSSSTTEAASVPSALPLSQLSALFASLSLTQTFDLPNSLLSTPTLTTPTYTFNTSIATTALSATLATSTYSAVFTSVPGATAESVGNVTALPVESPSPTQQTVVVTESGGQVVTTTSVAPTRSVQLGVPYGWASTNSARGRGGGGAGVAVAVAVGGCLMGGVGLLL